MKHKKVKLIVVLLTGLAISGLRAQTALPAASGGASGSGGSASYSVGQTVYTTNAGTNGTLAQGVQQAYEISIVTAIKGTNGISLSVSVYPNPAADYLILSADSYDTSRLSCQLYDISGKLLLDKIITSNRTPIAMNNLVPANYLLKIISENKEVKTFKIIKK